MNRFSYLGFNVKMKEFATNSASLRLFDLICEF